MNTAAALLVPLLILWPGDGGQRTGMPDEGPGVASAHQVRVTESVTIRVIARPAPLPPELLFAGQNRDSGPRWVERRIGNCLPAARIGSVQTTRDNRLIFHMRDNQMISAMLERSCRARDFYKGFYLERAQDGKLCVDRDLLQSRSGANCKLTRFRRLIAVND